VCVCGVCVCVCVCVCVYHPATAPGRKISAECELFKAPVCLWDGYY